MPDSHHLKRPPVVTVGSSSSSLGLRLHAPLARPSYTRSGSSASSLGGLEQTIQPFQEFIKQTRPVGPEKPLPPIPLDPKHLFNASSMSEDMRPQILDPPQDVTDRRSSSVYSRTPSQWKPESRSLENLDIDHDSYLLQSDSHVPYDNIRQATTDSLEPRRFSPLLVSPSPTLSAVSTLPRSRPTTLMLNTPLARERPKVRLMSLDKANLAFNAPGAVHLLPEELRAQSSKKLSTRAKTHRDSQDMFSSPRPPPLPPAPLSHVEERTRSSSTGASVSPYSKPRLGSKQQSSGHGFSINSFHVGTGPARKMAPPPLLDPPRRSWDDESGRSRQRGRASREAAPPEKFFVHNSPSRARTQQRGSNHREPSESASYNSEDDVRGHMKMIPQPLFQAKSPTQPRKPIDVGASPSFGISHFRMQRESQASASSGRSSGGGFPLRLSITPPPRGMRHRQSKSSTTGMIPISPPSENDSGRNQTPPPVNTDHKFLSKATLGQETNISSQKFMSRMKKMAKTGNAKTTSKRPSIGAPLLPADVVAAVLLTPDTTPQTSPLASNTLSSTGRNQTPSNLSAEGKKPLYQRFKGMTKHVRRGSKQQDMSPEESPIASPHSPHLFAIPAKALQSTYSEWSETAKATWDQARLTAFSSRENPSQAVTTDENEGGVEDVDNIDSRRPTLFGPFMESYRETKAQKRRDDLKKRIKVVTPLDEASEVGDSGNESDGDSVVQKRRNSYGWM